MSILATIVGIALALVVGFIAGLVTSWYLRKRSLVDKVDKKPQ